MKKARVIVIDDEPSVVDAVKMILSEAGYDATAAFSGGDALERARGGKGFDVAIIDLKLPDMSGLAALGVISEACPGIAAILITAHETDQVRADAITAGFAAVLPKPFSPPTLLEVVDSVLSQRGTSLRLTTPERRA